MAKKVCFCSSSGGHFEQLLMLKPLMEKYDSSILTEKTKYRNQASDNQNDFSHVFLLPQVNRTEFLWFIKLLWTSAKSLYVYLKLRPQVVVCTGALSMIPFSLIAKIGGAKLIYIESFAKVSSPTITGKVLYRFTDRFYVQWESMLKYYPKAIYLGALY